MIKKKEKDREYTVRGMKKRFFHEMTVVAYAISTSDSFTKS
jgi:hypothetical protein